MTITPASGFVTSDDTFYRNREEANYHENLIQTRDAYSLFIANKDLDFENTILFIKAYPDTIASFCFAIKELDDFLKRKDQIAHQEPNEIQTTNDKPSKTSDKASIKDQTSLTSSRS